MNRRRFVLVAGTAGMVGVAGCLGFGDDDDDPDDEVNGDDPGDGTNGQDNGAEDAEQLEAAFEFDPENPDPGEEVNFDASGSSGDISTYGWVFEPRPDEGLEQGDITADDVETTDDPVITHTFEQAGEYITILTVSDTEEELTDGDATSEASATVLVGIDEPVEPAFEWEPEEPEAGEAVSFDAATSTGDIVEFRWDFTGDGQFDSTSDEPTATHTFDESGTQSVVLEVEGSLDQRREVQQTVSVGETTGQQEEGENDDDGDEELEAAFTVTPENPQPGEEVTFDASASTGDIGEYRWNFTGDRQFDVTTDEPTLTRTFDHRQRPEVTLEIEDESGTTVAVDRQRVGIGHDDAIEVFFTPPELPEAGTEVTFEVDAVAGPDPILEFRWDFTGDGQVDATTSDQTVTHTFEDSGAAFVTLLAEDESGRVGVWTEPVGVVE